MLSELFQVKFNGENIGFLCFKFTKYVLLHICSIFFSVAFSPSFTTKTTHKKNLSIKEKFLDKKPNLFKNYQIRRTNKIFPRKILKAPIKIPKTCKNSVSIVGFYFMHFQVVEE